MAFMALCFCFFLLPAAQGRAAICLTFRFVYFLFLQTCLDLPTVQNSVLRT